MSGSKRHQQQDTSARPRDVTGRKLSTETIEGKHGESASRPQLEKRPGKPDDKDHRPM